MEVHAIASQWSGGMDVFDDRKPGDLIKRVPMLRLKPGEKMPVMLLGDFRGVKLHWIGPVPGGYSMPHIRRRHGVSELEQICPWCPARMYDEFYGPGVAPFGEFYSYTKKHHGRDVAFRGRRVIRVIVPLSYDAYLALDGLDLLGLQIVLHKGSVKGSPVLLRFPDEQAHAEAPDDLRSFDIVPHLWSIWHLTPEILKREQLKIYREKSG